MKRQRKLGTNLSPDTTKKALMSLNQIEGSGSKAENTLKSYWKRQFYDKK